MKISPSESEAIIQLLTRIYMDIHAIEEEYQLFTGRGDFRPRIEHFHDAIRAFSAQDPSGPPDPRLSIDRLSYDVQALRYIVSMPLSSFRADEEDASPATDMMVMDKNLMVNRAPRPDRAVKERLSELYQNYAVLFAALLKPNADRDYHDRVDNLNQDVEDLHKISGNLDALTRDAKQLPKVLTAIAHLEEEELRQQLLNFMQQQKFNEKSNVTTLIEFLKQYAGRKDKEIAEIEEAHLQYAMTQLGIYENSRDFLKKMAAQGMNLVGKFVEKAMADSKREIGR